MQLQHAIDYQPGQGPQNAQAALKLLESGASIPFIARYRKDECGGLDEVQLQQLEKWKQGFDALQNRRQAMLKSLEERNLITEKLREELLAANTLTALEDLYLPFKSQRVTRADQARKAGLEPLAKMMMAGQDGNPEDMARRFVKGPVKNTEDAISGAMDIVASWVNEHLALRNKLRRVFQNEALVKAEVMKGKEEEAEVYRDYFNFEEPARKIKAHRILAVFRGENEGLLKLSIAPDRSRCLSLIESQFVRGEGAGAQHIKKACADAYSRLLRPSLQNDLKQELRERAEEEATRIFVNNLRQLLMAPPLGAKRVIAIDPGFKSGCKVVCLDEQGQLLAHDTIYPHPPQRKTNAARNALQTLVRAHNIEVVAIGNGTAGRETEMFIKGTPFKSDLDVYMVNEDGASVYSASSVGRAEFPKHDVTVRGAVSIGRRLMDPLAELVKIDPQSLGVGQYQHDVEKNRLKRALQQCVESVVNEVGVDINTASPYLLAYVSGLGSSTAQSIVDYRSGNGPFKNRKELLSVPGLGAKTHELCAGFLRIQDGDEPLDNTAVHPESYALVKAIAKNLGVDHSNLIRNTELIQKVDRDKWLKKGVGSFTLNDVLAELEKPSRDPRRRAYMVEFDKRISSPSDLVEGSEMWGVVTNITSFGAFVDVGVKQDGLVHISELADRFISDPFQVVQINQPVRVKVLSVDVPRKRIALSMKQATLRTRDNQG
ncbi:MAG: RNA-binding transcriptional accessory protein [Cryomorphaceae bacterium]|nr:MAG: RNA-binding transcriptional accessory protein [Cryomorphaceae bacterium]